MQNYSHWNSNWSENSSANIFLQRFSWRARRSTPRWTGNETFGYLTVIISLRRKSAAVKKERKKNVEIFIDLCLSRSVVLLLWRVGVLIWIFLSSLAWALNKVTTWWIWPDLRQQCNRQSQRKSHRIFLIGENFFLRPKTETESEFLSCTRLKIVAHQRDVRVDLPLKCYASNIRAATAKRSLSIVRCFPTANFNINRGNIFRENLREKLLTFGEKVFLNSDREILIFPQRKWFQRDGSFFLEPR